MCATVWFIGFIGCLLFSTNNLNQHEGLRERTSTRLSVGYSDDKRSKTDCLCFVIFVLFSVAMLAIGIYAWTNGNFKKLTNAYDPDGKGCGVDYPNSPYIYFAQPSPNVKFLLCSLSMLPLAFQPVRMPLRLCLPVRSTLWSLPAIPRCSNRCRSTTATLLVSSACLPLQ